MPRQRAIAAEGRAIAARPSLCLLAAVTAIALLIAAPMAYAVQPEELTLHDTNPHSEPTKRANSTTPRVLGGEEEIIESVVRFGPSRPIAAAGGNPSNIVKIFTNSTCQEGTEVATGTLSELQTSGIQVEVAPDSETTFYANQAEPSEPENPSPCSTQGVTYYESSTIIEEPPAGGEGDGGGGSGGNPLGGEQPSAGVSANAPVAPRLRTVPFGRANDNSPLVTGSAAGAERVKVFTNPGCAGAPVANVSAAEFSAGIAVHVDDNTTTDFAGVSVADGRQSFCSPPATYIEDSSPPQVRITMGPGVKTRRHKAVFRFSAGSEDLGASFRCRLNHGNWRPCHSPFKLKHLHFRRYILRVRGTDAVGNTTPKPAKRSFKVIH
jgi:hypothetical protein